MIDRSYWGKKIEETGVRQHGTSSRILGIGIFITGLLFLAVALIMGFEFPKLIYTGITGRQCYFSDQSINYEQWKNDDFYTHYNRIYYFVIDNVDDYLYRKQKPKIREVGPYVYKESRKHTQIDLLGSKLSYEILRQQTFDEHQTRLECGINCHENDKLNIFNLEYLYNVSLWGGENNFILSNIPDLLQHQLHLAFILYNGTDFYGDLAKFPSEDWLQSNPNASLNWSITNWITQQTIIPEQLLTNLSFNRDEIQALYNVIIDPQKFGTTCLNGLKSSTQCINAEQKMTENECVYKDTNQHCKNAQKTEKQNATSEFGLIQHLENWKLTNDTIHHEHIQQLLCSTVANFSVNSTTDCFVFDKHNMTLNIFMDLLFDYIFSHLALLSHNSLPPESRNLIFTSTQQDIAKGYFTGEYKHKGILTNNFDVKDTFQENPRWIFYTCLHENHIKNNFLLTEYDNHTCIPAIYFPRVTASSKLKVNGYVYFTPQAPLTTVCRTPVFYSDKYSMFMPEFWRTLTFSKQNELEMNCVRVGRYLPVNDEFKVDGFFIEEDGIQNVTQQCGYMSFLSHPYSTASNITQVERKTKSNKSHCYIYIEPVTGQIWHRVISFQFNIKISRKLFDSKWKQPLNLASFEHLLPVYWVKTVTTMTQIQPYKDFVTNMRRWACGGLISFTLLALSIMMCGSFIIFKPYVFNRVYPLPEATT
ncbi:uncharacterized protein LOC106880172 isoform X1 [Octopus bimaculoides]|uniref:Uncharacterized protein n=2 Tax=Octopus bimaculoides TaxID=37653 RepID=A0A0L8FZP4_OCTBM|nr:uncharacterized protein LOC106880172 isoform X1 [Octopus bimaculoides]|eukprot:XP_014785503.1 PREDICTED: uncharacterized protein LOC106880172 isoform X1 [Octopus bimaculoides]